MKELALILCTAWLVTLIYADAIAQTTFQRTYGGASSDYGWSVQQTTDGGYIIAGSTYSFGAGSLDVYLIKTNSVGDTLWTKTYGSVGYDEGSSVQQTSDGGYIIAGTTNSFGAGNVYLIKTNSIGDTLWTKTYGGANSDGGHSVQQTSDGGYVIAGTTSSFGAGNLDLYLIKTNSVGDTVWTKTYGSASYEYGGRVQQTSDSGYIIAGTTAFEGLLIADVYLVKTNSVGNAIWTKTYGGVLADFGNSVRQTSDGGYIIAGETNSFGVGGFDVYLIKTNSVGDTLWTKTYGGANFDYGHSVQQTSDGGYIIAGHIDIFGADLNYVYLIKTNSVGDTLWTKTYGGALNDVAHSVQQTSDGGYIIAGTTSSFGAGGYDDVYLIKTDANGVVTGTSVNNPRGIPSEFVLKQNYPNPFNPSTIIQYELPAESWVSLKVYNLFGQEVATLVEGKQEAGYKTVEWNASRQVGIASGVCFYRLRAGSFTETKKSLFLR